ncbi:hypothetical protein [Bordetella pertussis]|uniref:hypothetical protein n=1 Tax=Bordetella pertussis TaxID=520 RepID=UPI0039B72B09
MAFAHGFNVHYGQVVAALRHTTSSWCGAQGPGHSTCRSSLQPLRRRSAPDRRLPKSTRAAPERREALSVRPAPKGGGSAHHREPTSAY